MGMTLRSEGDGIGWTHGPIVPRMPVKYDWSASMQLFSRYTEWIFFVLFGLYIV